MSRVLLRLVGTLPLRDLQMIGEFEGRDFLPYPFMFTQPSRFATRDEAMAYANTVPDRFKYGDLSSFRECIAAYNAADIRVGCHVQYIPAVTPSVRAVAYRAGELGFFAAQRPDSDLIDIHVVSPYDLGEAIADAVTLMGPGCHQKIVVPEYAPRAKAEFDTGDFVIRHRQDPRDEFTVAASEVTAYATVQSNWRPMRTWGRDRNKEAAIWVRIHGDGEYLYARDLSHASPMTRPVLHERIDQLIGDDVAILKEFHRG
ncbi:ESX secretion-associated protein EspG [Mycobacterium sp. 1482292.6]|nr:ESX secretion-associated protein EspG [Mycobacterium sp. 1482292.6]